MRHVLSVRMRNALLPLNAGLKIGERLRSSIHAQILDFGEGNGGDEALGVPCLCDLAV